jgi:hypothetical protein
MVAMADSEDPGALSVNVDDLKRGGVYLDQIAEVAKKIHDDLQNMVNSGLTLGDDQISQLILQNYKPSEKTSLEFLKNLTELIDAHGGKTIDLSKIFNDVNTTTVDEVNAPDGSTHGTSLGIKAH